MGVAAPPARMQPPRRTPCAPPCATCVHGGGHLCDQFVQVGRRCRVPPCATIATGAGQWAAVARTTVRDVRARVPASGRRCRAPPCKTGMHECRPEGAALAARCVHNRVHPIANRARQLRTSCATGAWWRAATCTTAVIALLIRSTTEITIPSSVCTRKRDECFMDGISSSRQSEQVRRWQQAAVRKGGRRRKGGGGRDE
ncbi:hypothetical protein F511_33269 [Dorcoceras hygrometricum]|uniref:Uncharacterized protein n=1 Tax=Dorcoceras hygrometricum TaxID=472368 RepID=A0A2Z7BMJ8_9LAMI|nr:hypothetical protein F511_33269 [Dorcoceras hygrometricum]